MTKFGRYLNHTCRRKCGGYLAYKLYMIKKQSIIILMLIRSFVKVKWVGKKLFWLAKGYSLMKWIIKLFWDTFLGMVINSTVSILASTVQLCLDKRWHWALCCAHLHLQMQWSSTNLHIGVFIWFEVASMFTLFSASKAWKPKYVESARLTLQALKQLM